MSPTRARALTAGNLHGGATEPRASAGPGAAGGWRRGHLRHTAAAAGKGRLGLGLGLSDEPLRERGEIGRRLA